MMIYEEGVLVGDERIFTVRGIAVRAVAGNYGWELHATARGYFPVSETGFRSCSGQEVGAPMLESLAANFDRERADALRRVRIVVARPPVDGAGALRDSISRFIHVSMAAERAAAVGLFAPDAERGLLWPFAARALGLILEIPTLQPIPRAGGGAWDGRACALVMGKVRSLQAALLRAIAGDVRGLEGALFGVSAYLGLPDRPGGEPVFAPLSFNAELGLELPDAGEADDEEGGAEADPLDEDLDTPADTKTAAPVASPAGHEQFALF